jgi:hypothetical protein
MNLTMISDFMQVVTIKREHYTNSEYFPKHILFTTIYLLPEQKLNYNKYSKHEINMGNFVQSTEYDVHMYAKIQGLKLHGCL